MAKIKKRSAEVVNRHRSSYHLTFSKRNAEHYAGIGIRKRTRAIYQLPNGIYAVRKKRKKKR